MADQKSTTPPPPPSPPDVDPRTSADRPAPATQPALGHQAAQAPTADNPPTLSEGVAQDIEQARARIRNERDTTEVRVGEPAGGEWVVTGEGDPTYEAPVRADDARSTRAVSTRQVGRQAAK